MRFFTSDQHFYHKNVISYCGRPWATAEEMNEGLIKNWNEVVRPEDEVFTIGDFSFAGVEKTKAIVDRLNGKKTIIMGNHDRFGLDKAGAIFGSAFRGMFLEIGGEQVQLCHYPYRGDHTATERYKDRRPVDNGGWLLHGHIHNAWKVKDMQINVGVDVWDWRPVSERQICEIMAMELRDAHE